MKKLIPKLLTSWEPIVVQPDAIALNYSVQDAELKRHMKSKIKDEKEFRDDEMREYYQQWPDVWDKMQNNPISDDIVELASLSLKNSGLKYREIIDNPGWYELLEQDGSPSYYIVNAYPAKTDGNFSKLLDEYVNMLGYGKIQNQYLVPETRTWDQIEHEAYIRQLDEYKQQLVANNFFHVGGVARDPQFTAPIVEANGDIALSAFPGGSNLITGKYLSSGGLKLINNDPSDDRSGYWDIALSLAPIAINKGLNAYCSYQMNTPIVKSEAVVPTAASLAVPANPLFDMYMSSETGLSSEVMGLVGKRIFRPVFNTRRPGSVMMPLRTAPRGVLPKFIPTRALFTRKEYFRPAVGTNAFHKNNVMLVEPQYNNTLNLINQ